MKHLEITKIKWFLYHLRERTPLLMYIFTHGSLVTDNPVLKEKVKNIGNCVDHLLGGRKAWDYFSDHLWKAYLSNPDRILSYMQYAFLDHIEDQKKWRRLLSRDYVKVSNQELLRYYGQYIDSALRYGGYTFVPLAIEKQLTDCVLEILHKNFPGEEQYFEDMVMTPDKSTSIASERVNLLKLAIAFGDKSKNFEKLLDKHVELFGFLKSKGMFLEFYDRDYFKKQIEQIVNPAMGLSILIREQKKTAYCV